MAAVAITAGIFYATRHSDSQEMSTQAPLLVRDSNDSTSLPKKFRILQNKEGLENLRISGSGAFSQNQLQNIKARLGNKRITLVDLRQESHGFINGEGVSWYGVANAANREKTLIEVTKDENARLEAIKALTRVELADIQDKTDGVIKRYTPIPVNVKTVQTEEDLAYTLGLDYKRFAVRDHARPTDMQVDDYVIMIRDLPEDGWLHVHCRGGKGRTTTFLAMYDMIENAKQVPLQDIIARQYAAGGSNLFKKNVDSYKAADAMERRHFLEEFYRYTKENNDGFRTLWSQWLQSQNKTRLN